VASFSVFLDRVVVVVVVVRSVLLSRSMVDVVRSLRPCHCTSRVPPDFISGLVFFFPATARWELLATRVEIQHYFPF